MATSYKAAQFKKAFEWNVSTTHFCGCIGSAEDDKLRLQLTRQQLLSHSIGGLVFLQPPHSRMMRIGFQTLTALSLCKALTGCLLWLGHTRSTQQPFWPGFGATHCHACGFGALFFHECGRHVGGWGKTQEPNPTRPKGNRTKKRRKTNRPRPDSIKAGSVSTCLLYTSPSPRDA